MVVDASRSPESMLKRTARYLVLAVLIAAITLFIWSKELHHSPAKSHGRHAAATAVYQARGT